MDTKFEIKFKTQPYIPNTGKRFKPDGAVEVQHPDGTKLYLNPCSYERAIEMFIMNCRHNTQGDDAKYISYLYSEYILDFNDENMFSLAIDDFENWKGYIE